MWANIKEMAFEDLKGMFEATIGRASTYTEKDRAKLEKSTYEILSGSLEGTPRGAHDDESSSDDEGEEIGRSEEEEKEKVKEEKFKAKKKSPLSEEDQMWVQKLTCPRCKTTINSKTNTAFTSKNQVTGHLTHCKKVPEQQQTRPKVASGKSEKKRTVEMRAEEEEKEKENKKKAIRVIDDMLKKKQKSTSTQIPKRSSKLLDVVMKKEIPPVKTNVNGGSLPVIPKLTVSPTAMEPPPPRFVQQQKQTQQTQRKADENKHLDDFRIEMPSGFVAPEGAETCLLIKTNARNVTEREVTNLFRFFQGFQHVTVRDDTSFFGAGGEKQIIHVQFREKENAAYAKSKTDKFILDSKDPINSVLNIGYFSGYTPPSSATARDAHKAITTHPSASADNPLPIAAKSADLSDGVYCDLCEVTFSGNVRTDAVIKNCWKQHVKSDCHQQNLKSKKIEGAEYFRFYIVRHPVTDYIHLRWICDCCHVIVPHGKALWGTSSGHAFGKKHAEAMREKKSSANATRSTHLQDPRMKSSENSIDDLAKDKSPSKTPTARNTLVSGQLEEGESKSDWLQFKEARSKKITPYEKESTDFIDLLPMDGEKKVNVEVSLEGCDASYFDERMVDDLKRKIMEEDSGFVVKKFNERNVIWLYGNKTSTKSAWLRTRELRHIAAKLSEQRVNSTGIWKLDGLRNLVSKGLIKEYKPEITSFMDDETQYKRDTEGKITIAEEIGDMLGMLKGSKYITQRQTEEYLGQKLKVKYEILENGEVKFTGYPEGVAKAWLLIREFCFLGAEEGKKREREARKEVVKSKPARIPKSCPHYDPRTKKCGWANSVKNRGRTACRYCFRNDSR